MTSNVLPLHFAPNQASSSQNSNVDDTLEGYKIKSALPYKIFSTLLTYVCKLNFPFSLDIMDLITAISLCVSMYSSRQHLLFKGQNIKHHSSAPTSPSPSFSKQGPRNRPDLSRSGSIFQLNFSKDFTIWFLTINNYTTFFSNLIGGPTEISKTVNWNRFDF